MFGKLVASTHNHEQQRTVQTFAQLTLACHIVSAQFNTGWKDQTAHACCKLTIYSRLLLTHPNKQLYMGVVPFVVNALMSITCTSNCLKHSTATPVHRFGSRISSWIPLCCLSNNSLFCFVLHSKRVLTSAQTLESKPTLVQRPRWT